MPWIAMYWRHFQSNALIFFLTNYVYSIKSQWNFSPYARHIYSKSHEICKHDFVLLWLYYQSFVESNDPFIHIFQGHFTGTLASVWLLGQSYYYPIAGEVILMDMGKYGHYLTTTKHNKTGSMAGFLQFTVQGWHEDFLVLISRIREFWFESHQPVCFCKSISLRLLNTVLLQCQI